METVKENKLIHPALQSILDTFEEKKIKVVDIVYDKVPNPVEDTLKLEDIKLTLVIAERIKNEYIGILYKPELKKSFKVIPLSMFGSALFCTTEDIRTMKYINEDMVFEALDKAMNDRTDNSKHRNALNALSTLHSNTEIGFSELLGRLIYAKGIPAMKVEKAVMTLPEEMKSKLVAVILWINTFFNRYDLNAFLRYNNVLLASAIEVAVEMTNKNRERDYIKYLFMKNSPAGIRELLIKLDRAPQGTLQNINSLLTIQSNGNANSQAGALPKE